MESKHKSIMKPINIKTNTTAVLNNQRLHKITTVFRFMETFFLLIMISRLSSQLPSFVKLAEYYLYGRSFMVFSHKFMFVVGNLIILILFFISRVVEHEHKDDIGEGDLCYEYVKGCDQSVVNAPVVVGVVSDDVRICRSKSEDLISGKCVNGGNGRELRRSVTEIGRLKSSGDGGEPVVKRYVKDEMSCEDFRRTVEAFIARQQKILRDEELSSVV